MILNLTLNGTSVTAKEGDTILEVARANEVFIPTLCHHKALSAYASCRLCLVEVQINHRKRVVAACSYLVQADLAIDTEAPAAIKARKIAIELLLARCSDNPAVREMAEKIGVKETRFPKAKEDCILCGLCVRVCREAIHADCISFAGRGAKRHIKSPFGKPPRSCNGCGACAAVCPTGAIRMHNTGVARTLPLLQSVVLQERCPACGCHFAPEKQMAYLRLQATDPEGLLQLCPDCRRQRFGTQAVNFAQEKQE